MSKKFESNLPSVHVKRPPLSGWIGGKSRLASHIVQMIPEHTCYVEPFAGAAWIFFRKPESKVEILNDINRDLVTLYRVIQHHLEEFIRYFKWVLISRDEFERLKRATPDTLTDIQRAARFYYLQQMAFGGHIHNPTFGYASTRAPKLNLLRIEEELSAAHLRLSRAYVECLSYNEVIVRYDKPESFFYLDPPYWDCENYYGKGLFGKEDFTKLANQLVDIKGKFILSLNDTKGVRETFKAFSFKEVKVNYSCSNGRNVRANEVIIKNF